MSASPDILALAMRSLPHGPEFRFVDRMISLTPGVRGVGEYKVRGDEYYLRGHLPGEPIMPGVLLVEAGAQVAGMVAQEDPANPRWPQMKLASLRAVKILGSVRPGETLIINVELTKSRGKIGKARGVCTVDGETVSEAEVTFMLMDA